MLPFRLSAPILMQHERTRSTGAGLEGGEAP